MDALWRIVDVGTAMAGLVFIAPLLAALALAIWAMDGSSPTIAHRRVGLGGRHFRYLKLRTMCVDTDAWLRTLLNSDPQADAEWARDHKLRCDPQITPLGQFLRKSSLDKLPQLFNVLVGEMSLVGPRLIVDAEAARYGRRFAHYVSVRPGLTGLW